MKVRIKRLTKLNSKQLLQLEACEQAVFADGGLNRWTLPVIARYGFLFTLQKTSSPVIGLASFISRGTARRAPTAFLIGLWVDEKHRNQGYGQVLLTESISQLKKSGINQIELTVSEKNEIACKMYEKTGFKIHCRMKDFYGPSQSRLLLKRNLLQ